MSLFSLNQSFFDFEIHREGAVDASDELDRWLLLDVAVDDDDDDANDASGLIRRFGMAPSERFVESGLCPGLGPDCRLGGKLAEIKKTFFFFVTDNEAPTLKMGS